MADPLAGGGGEERGPRAGPVQVRYGIADLRSAFRHRNARAPGSGGDDHAPRKVARYKICSEGTAGGGLALGPRRTAFDEPCVSE